MITFKLPESYREGVNINLMKKNNIIITLIFSAFIINMSSCIVRVPETHKKYGTHRGWFIHRSHHPHQTWVIRKWNYKQPKATRTVKVEIKSKKKNR
jgi:hypothetical protein